MGWVSVYRVEVDHGGGWEHRHPAEWTDTTDGDTARTYADRLRDAHPGSGVRVVEEVRVVGDGVVSQIGEEAQEL